LLYRSSRRPSPIDRQLGLHVILPLTLLVLVAAVVAVTDVWTTAAEQTRQAVVQAIEVAQAALDRRRQQLAAAGGERIIWQGGAPRLVLRRAGERAATGSLDGPWVRQAFLIGPGGLTLEATIDDRFGRGFLEQHLTGGIGILLRAVRRNPAAGTRTGLVLADGKPALAAVAALAPPGGSSGTVERQTYLLVQVEMLDQALIRYLAELHDLPDLRLAPAGEEATGERLPLRAVDGSDLGSLVWRTPRPGNELLARVGPALGAVLLGVLTLSALVLGHARRATKLLRESERRAVLDALTGLPNRRLLHDRLDQVTARLDREGGMAAVLYLDLDRFKQINDSLGHEIGDRLLVEVARRLRRVVREADTVARLGGDEFVVVQVGIGAPGEAAVLASRLITCLRDPFRCADRLLAIGVSIGIALAPLDGREGSELLRTADRALYRAKAAGGCAFRFHEAPPARAGGGRIRDVAA
jgi:diguanylate cyclase (GGDEF)-like protein